MYLEHYLDSKMIAMRQTCRKTKNIFQLGYGRTFSFHCVMFLKGDLNKETAAFTVS